MRDIKDSLLELTEEYGISRTSMFYPIHAATEIGALKLVEFLLHTERNINDEDAFHTACHDNQLKIVKLFLESSRKFDIDINLKDVDEGKTGFHYACCFGHIEVVKLMIGSRTKYDIEFDAGDYQGLTPFHLACYNGKTETVRLLLENKKELGINIEAKMTDDDGVTFGPLDLVNERIQDGDKDTNANDFSGTKKLLEEEYAKNDASEPLPKKRAL